MERQKRNTGEPEYRLRSLVERHKFGKRNYREERIMYVSPFWGTINPLSQDQMVPAVHKLVTGESFDFASERATEGYWSQIEKRNSPFIPIVITILDQQGIENKKACAILVDDLKRFSPDKSLLSEPNLLKEWLFKLTLGVYAHPSIAIKLSQDKDLIDSELGKYYKEVEKQIGIFRQTLAGLGKDDLAYYIRLEDLFDFYGTLDLFGSPLPTTLPDENKEAISTALFAAVVDNSNILRSSLLEEDKDAWDRLRINWRAKQIQEALSLLPKISSSSVKKHIILALEENLFDFSERSSLDGSEELKIDLLGIIALLKWKSEYVYGGEYDIFAKTYPRVILQSEENLEFANFSVPRKHLPHAAMRILAETAKRSDKTEFTNLIKSVHELTVGEEVNVPWFITLLALRAHDSETSQVVEQIVSGLDALPVPVREIFLSKLPGKLWLTRDGKLRSTDSRTMLLSAFPIFTSLKEDSKTIEQEQQNPKKEEPKKPEAKNLAVDKTDNIPFFGEIGKIKETDVKMLLDCMIKERIDLDDGYLLDEFEQLTIAWKQRDESFRDRNLIYIPRLNVSDKRLSKAQRCGIEGVYIKGEEATLILSKDFAFGTASNKAVPLGLHGKVNELGYLLADGMDQSFVGEREHLFLNNLVLHLALQPLLYKSGIPEEEDKELIREINKVTSSWNRSTLRGLLPKIDRKTKILNLALRIDGYKEPVLVGEKLK